jgi:hypothetical protein
VVPLLLEALIPYLPQDVSPIAARIAARQTIELEGDPIHIHFPQNGLSKSLVRLGAGF